MNFYDHGFALSNRVAGSLGINLDYTALHSRTAIRDGSDSSNTVPRSEGGRTSSKTAPTSLEGGAAGDEDDTALFKVYSPSQQELLFCMQD